jgi:valyl-tRNA synthetase
MKKGLWSVDKKILDKGKSLKELMREAVTTGFRKSEEIVEIQPQRFKQIYLTWIDNLRDWCISRQIWWDIEFQFGIGRQKTHEMKIYGEDIFNNIKSGKKKYETRLINKNLQILEKVNI